MKKVLFFLLLALFLTGCMSKQQFRRMAAAGSGHNLDQEEADTRLADSATRYLDAQTKLAEAQAQQLNQTTKKEQVK